ncbi:serine/threonine-protein kinase [Pendulispora brunnea]|uniref:Serine/threonine-protein kinase n=2 Tax=Pendulispora brunnea TaxID=2905690 RepID=A0ABZ2KL22_9BACT
MGIVVRAIDRTTQRRIALKVLHGTDDTALRRFAREAEALQRLQHPAIVAYFDHGVTEGGRPYLAMEWIEGESLRMRLERAHADGGMLGTREVVELGHRLAGALEAAHARGIIHRDVKPSNVLLVGGDPKQAKLADFGIVQPDSGTDLTTSGVVMGTVGYMAPEQARGDGDLDGRADLFSLGCVLFRCLTGVEVFQGTATVTVLAKLLLHDAPRVSEYRADVPRALDDMVARLLAKDRESRPTSAAEVGEELERILEDLGRVPETQPRAKKRRSGARWSLIALALLVAGGLVVHHRRSASAPVQPIAALPPPADTAITELPVSPACTTPAVDGYREGLQALRSARWSHALELFEEAAKADPACPELQFRLLVTSEPFWPLPKQQEQLHRAFGVRDRLTERDRKVLEAWTFVVGRDTAQEEDAVRVFEEAMRLFPGDAELRNLHAARMFNLAPSGKALENVLARVDEALKIDPGYADAWAMRGRFLARLGRLDEELIALDQCLALEPAAVDCMEYRVYALRRRGRCADAVAEARRWISWDREETLGYRQLAISLASQRSPAETVEEAMQLRWERLPPKKRPEVSLFERSRWAAWRGRFDEALTLSDELERVAAKSGAEESHWRAALTAIDALLETGQESRAASLAEKTLRRKDAWVKTDLNVIRTAYYEPQLFATELRAGRIGLDQWRALSDAWEHANETRLDAVERWVFRWGPAAGSGIDAAEAVRQAPTIEHRQAVRSPNINLQGVLNSYEGKLYLEADDATRAAPLLEKGAAACISLDFPYLNVRAHLWEGMAKQRSGDIAGACDAYQSVIDQWGAAKPFSVTARRATELRRPLACPR